MSPSSLPRPGSAPPPTPPNSADLTLQERYEHPQQVCAEAETTRQYYQNLYEHAPVAYCTLSADGTINQLNQQAVRLLGRPPQQLLGVAFVTLVEPIQRWDFLYLFGQMLATDLPQTGEVVLRTAEGKPLAVQLESVVVVTPAGQRQCHLALLDITEARQVALVLAANEQKFRRLFEQSTDALALMQNEQFVDCNAAALQLFGATDPNQILGHYPWDMAPLEQKPGVNSATYFQQTVAAALKTGSKRCEGILCRLSGEFMWVEAVLTPLKTEGELLLHVLWRDITAQKQEQSRRQECEEQLQLLLHATEAGLWSWDVTTNQVQCNAQARACFGWPPTSESVPLPLELLQASLHPTDADRLPQALEQACQHGHLPQQLLRALWPNGTEHPLLITGKLVLNEFGQPQRVHGVVHPPYPPLASS